MIHARYSQNQQQVTLLSLCNKNNYISSAISLKSKFYFIIVIRLLDIVIIHEIKLLLF